MNARRQLYLIEILHQTTTCLAQTSFTIRCILSKFYIKPQPYWQSYDCPLCCILSKFYIKPQLAERSGVPVDVVSYRNSTSNHNFRVPCEKCADGCILSKFYIKPQQEGGEFIREAKLYLIEILHQTTTECRSSR